MSGSKQPNLGYEYKTYTDQYSKIANNGEINLKKLKISPKSYKSFGSGLKQKRHKTPKSVKRNYQEGLNNNPRDLKQMIKDLKMKVSRQNPPKTIRGIHNKASERELQSSVKMLNPTGGTDSKAKYKVKKNYFSSAENEGPQKSYRGSMSQRTIKNIKSPRKNADNHGDNQYSSRGLRQRPGQQKALDPSLSQSGINPKSRKTSFSDKKVRRKSYDSKKLREVGKGFAANGGSFRENPPMRNSSYLKGGQKVETGQLEKLMRESKTSNIITKRGEVFRGDLKVRESESLIRADIKGLRSQVYDQQLKQKQLWELIKLECKKLGIVDKTLYQDIVESSYPENQQKRLQEEDELGLDQEELVLEPEFDQEAEKMRLEAEIQKLENLCVLKSQSIKKMKVSHSGPHNSIFPHF